MPIWTLLRDAFSNLTKGDTAKQGSEPASKPETAARPDQSSTAVDQIRTTAKWLLTTFGAVAAVLVTGTQLSDIGDTSDGKFWLALFGAVLGLTGVGIVIWMTGRVLAPHRVGLDEITNDSNVGKWASNDPGLLKGQADTVEQLIERYRETLTAYVEARREAEASPDDTALRQEGKKKLAAYQAVENPMQFIRSLAIYDRVNSVFQDALQAIGAGIVFIGIGLLVFAYATGSASNERDKSESSASGQSSAIASPAAVTLAPTESGRKVLSDILGKDCAPGSVNALLLATAGQTLDLATFPSGKCPVTRFTINSDLLALKASTATLLPPASAIP